MIKVVFALVCLGMIALSGCGGGPTKYKVTGHLTKGGQILNIGEKTEVKLIFALQPEGSKNTFSATPKREDGSYALTVDPGNYKVNVLIMDYQNSVPRVVANHHGVNNAVYDVTGNQVIDIDIP
jgi:hypothetical protein